MALRYGGPWVPTIKDLLLQSHNLLKTMCNCKFLSKGTEEIWEYLDSFAENSQAWETEDTWNKTD